MITITVDGIELNEAQIELATLRMTQKKRAATERTLHPGDVWLTHEGRRYMVFSPIDVTTHLRHAEQGGGYVCLTEDGRLGWLPKTADADTHILRRGAGATMTVIPR